MLHRNNARRATAWRASRLIVPALFGAAWAGGPLLAATGPVRSTLTGQVMGLDRGDNVQFRAIPYAAPPLGSLRWRPPAPAASWSGVRDATAYGPACPQKYRAQVSEDCLTLNVTAPAGAVSNSRLPVMVYIHGGSLVYGGGADYDPAELVVHGRVVVVTLNYRLGYLGFLAHPALTANDPNHVSGNYGLLDQQAALGWVRANIANFGGDPSRITIFGESAGGQSVADQLVSPGAGKLAGGIIESGDYALALPDLATAEARGSAAAASLGCADQTAACLYALSADTLGNALSPVSTGDGGVSAVVDGRVMPLSPGAAFAGGHFQHVPVMHGTNHDEGRLFIGLGYATAGKTPATLDQFTANVTASYGDLAPSLLSLYAPIRFGNTRFAPDYATAAISTDSGLSCTAHLVSALLAQYVPVYQYELNDPNAPTRSGPPISGFSYGSAHTDDLSFLFPRYGTIPGVTPPLSASQARLALTMQLYWANFARYGRPLAPQGGAWPGFSLNSGWVQSFTPPGAAATGGFFADHHCDVWQSTVLTQAGLAAGTPY